MSQPLNSTNNTTICIDSSVKSTSVIPKTNIIKVERTPKRAFHEEQNNEAKKVKIEHQSINESITSTVPKFKTATEVASAGNTRSVQAMPEISDEELLEMALQFEKEHPYLY